METHREYIVSSGTNPMLAYPLGFGLGLVCGLIACWIGGLVRIEIHHHHHSGSATNRLELVIPQVQRVDRQAQAQ